MSGGGGWNWGTHRRQRRGHSSWALWCDLCRVQTCDPQLVSERVATWKSYESLCELALAARRGRLESPGGSGASSGRWARPRPGCGEQQHLLASAETGRDLTGVLRLLNTPPCGARMKRPPGALKLTLEQGQQLVAEGATLGQPSDARTAAQAQWEAAGSPERRSGPGSPGRQPLPVSGGRQAWEAWLMDGAAPGVQP